MGKSMSGKYGFYETPEWVSRLVAKNICVNQRAHLIDLGAGSGSLIRGIKELYKNCFCTGVELDKSHAKFLNKIADRVRHINLIENSVPKNLIVPHRQINVVSNPPFGKIESNSELRRLLQQNELVAQASTACSTRSEVVFLARALEVLKKGSSAAFIVPSTISTHDHWSVLRETLTEKHALEKMILLPEKVFSATEVESVIFFIRPYSGRSVKIQIEDHRESELKRYEVSIRSFVDGLVGKTISSGSLLLGPLVTDMYRGRRCSKELKNNAIDHLHSSDINSLHASKIALPKLRVSKKIQNERIAEAGDILVSRVGTRCLGSTVFVESGGAVISDSVISIRVPKKKAPLVFSKLASSKGREWLRGASRGACAKIITYETIQHFPLGSI